MERKLKEAVLSRKPTPRPEPEKGIWLRNGCIYQPWSTGDDENVRWIPKNEATITKGVER
ncbi:hypothetical protein [Sphingomonas sp. ERG5]|uniref:hypothetical protein n=1 Tax=Sphingomonas sp. ERG5 TaxID=1381597 RepID=UPI00126A192D|nr:hypothetical protein [Sphingomonas sp. ERG5]